MKGALVPPLRREVNQTNKLGERKKTKNSKIQEKKAKDMGAA